MQGEPGHATWAGSAAGAQAGDLVPISGARQSLVSAPSVSEDRRVTLDGSLHEPGQARQREVGHLSHANSAESPATVRSTAMATILDP